MTKRVAVSGASGFIGRHVIDELLQRGLDIRAFSRRPEQSQHEGLTQMSLDITEPGIDLFQRLGEPELLIHLAWDGLPNYRDDHHLLVELPRQLAFLESCIRSGLRRLVVTGTCLEYGMRSGELEETMEAAPVTTYAQAKHELHQRLLSLRSRHHFDLTWLRVFYVYGPGQSKRSLYSQLRSAVDAGSLSFEMSPADQIRDFLPIETAAVQIVDVALGHPDAGTLNICSGRPATVLETVQGWLRDWEIDLDLDLGVYGYPDYEPAAFWGSTKRLATLLENTE